ncbi:lipopolysaccharide biosynthesis protein [Mesorhizobium sp. M2D.F.Ca.ET.185.01.1.1]|uniref:GumC family protein n=1 Tax=unclassified Mesorhizobium TaxID=325217 RepID=UPI000FCCCD33|nr:MULTISPECIES: lipopolysaccharide biosynthesis protein [unclassified Mesorhizobium]TGP80986.1 lipopolysaccharide biosynthesis protein [bacterium M00.F.Ca.ET.227.01.1.1]TGP90769.1 lipopolysaccharide biosynthesis protein [bacterium M00.F.Ca.ET.221.01.1.1]TGP97448.1 lipopolysaccharide biosynthesis protein [bacterium M00.F.Ca.ET.222.01.1.1]TGT75979.1 lipopolysaccharide biosynthesis protein [bacterium M00.F.Ca.ET.159.01.1.1]TGT85040.1 lipopolysaccharide biosynthesis protein [bacterium M00.F.Ca.ET
MNSQDFRFYASLYVQRLRYLTIPVAIATAFGLAVALLLQPVYRSVAKILVEPPRISTDLARSSVTADPIQQLQVLEQQLTTRASLLGLAQKFAIFPKAHLPDDDVVAQMLARTRIEPAVLNNLGSGSGAIAFTISFDAADPVLAADVANAYANAMLEANERGRKAMADDTHEFFKREVDRLGAALKDAQEAVLSFKLDHREALPDSLEFRRMQQRAYEERLGQIQREIISVQQKRSTIQQISASGGQGALADDQQLTELRRSLAEQETIFNDGSANLVALRTRVADLEKRISEKGKAVTDVSRAVGMSPELRLQLADAEGQLSLITQEKEAIGPLLDDLKRSIADTEMNSTKLRALEQNYEAVQTQYNDAVARLANASTGQRIEKEAVGQKLSLIEPATPPEKRIWPKRQAIVLGSFGAGIALSFGIFALTEVFFPTIRRPADLAAVFRGQPFATIPYIAADSRKPAHNKHLGAMALVLLVGSGPIFLLVDFHPSANVGVNGAISK